MNIEKELISLGYKKDFYGCYKKRYRFTYIVIFVKNNKIDLEFSGVQKNGLNSFKNLEELKELRKTFITFYNHLLYLGFLNLKDIKK